MIMLGSGPFIVISFAENELTEGRKMILLPDGYSCERIFINGLNNISELIPDMSIDRGDHITFPVVNGKSPSVLGLFIPDTSKKAEIRFTIEKFGQIPDPYYFNTVFAPISVSDGEGNKYQVIPSDQFK